MRLFTINLLLVAAWLSSGCDSSLRLEIATQKGEDATEPAEDLSPVLSDYEITGPGKANATSDIVITWQNAGASEYVVMLSQTLDCSTPRYTFPHINGTSQIAAKLPDGVYYVCVYASDDQGGLIPARNNGFRFEIDSTPPGEFFFTTLRKRVNTLTPTIAWSEPTGVDRYQLSIATDTDCTKRPQSYENLRTRSLQLKQLRDKTTYYICLAAVDNAGNRQEIREQLTVDTEVPTARLAGVPTAMSAAHTLNAAVSGGDTLYYQYALLMGHAGTCETATYSSFYPVSAPLTATLASPGL